MIKQDDLLIRLMNANDFEMMVKWLNDEKVLQFYEEPPTDLNRVIKKYGPRIEGTHYVTPCIVELNEQPIGYIQYYEIQEEELKSYGYAANQGIYGIDQFIGETYLWGKGLGTAMIRMMLNYLSTTKNASRVMLEVKKSNMRAIASYKKCGFKVIKNLNNGLWLMEWSK